MVKSRFNVLDIQRCVAEMSNSLCGMFVNNIYDMDSKTFALKFNSPGRDKQMVVIESGVRCHITKFIKENVGVPSGFAMKLRKHLRQKRLLSVNQLGIDRVVDFCFGLLDKPDSQYHIMLEMYASGNVVLTDSSYRVLTLIRVFKDEDVRFAVGENYLDSIAKTHAEAQSDGGFVKSTGDIPGRIESIDHSLLTQQLKDYSQRSMEAIKNSEMGIGDKDSTKAKRKKSRKTGSRNLPNLKQALSQRGCLASLLGPDLIEHCIILADISPKIVLDHEFFQNEARLKKLVSSLRENGPSFLRKVNDINTNAGVIMLSDEVDESVKGDSELSQTKNRFYSRFETFPMEQHKNQKCVHFKSLNEAADEYFGKIIAQQHEKEKINTRNVASKKVDMIRRDHALRLKELENEGNYLEKCAQAIQFALPDVDSAIKMIRFAVGKGMAWDEIDDLLDTERLSGNSVAKLIQDIQLEKNQVVLRLFLPDYKTEKIDVCSDQEESDEEDDDGMSNHSSQASAANGIDRLGFVTATVSILESAHSNVSALYLAKKQVLAKMERTRAASNKVLDKAEQKFAQQMEKLSLDQKRIRVSRKSLWFEKFRWFITSEGFLVISGRDAQQNELIVKKFLRASHGDKFIHADIHGASSCVVRSPKPGVVIPLESLRQAGAMTACTSRAWADKVVVGAWYVDAHQVSKTAPSGEYLSTGSFMIRGKKTFLPPAKLELVFGLLFKLDETQGSLHERECEWRVQQLCDDEDSENEFASNGGNGILEDIEEQEIMVKSDIPSMVSKDELPVDIDETIITVGGRPRIREPRETRREANFKESLPTQAQDSKIDESISAAKKMVRGKKGKLKKIKAKYAHQTEEDRRLAMRALGHRLSDSTETAETSENAVEKQKSPGEHGLEVDSSDNANSFGISSTAAVKANVIKKSLDTRTNEPEEVEFNLNGFTMNPKDNDVLLYALPFCGPPQCAVSCKYRVKLTPGGEKRGKAAQHAQTLFSKLSGTCVTENGLIRDIPNNDMVMAMHGPSRLWASDARNVGKQSKRSRSSKRIKKPKN